MADAKEELLVRVRETGAHARCNMRQGRKNVTLRRLRRGKEDVDVTPHMDLDWL